jgi:DNA-binding XRE family transcriptional regulator
MAKISWHGSHYAVPIKILEHYKTKSNNENDTSIDELLIHLTQKSGEPGVLLKGLRYREGLNQIKFANQLNISQTNLSAMENGKRVIGKALAKRIANIFGLDYRIFL